MAKLRGAAVYLLTQWKYSPVALYACAFCMAVIISMQMVVLPWRIIALGGKELAVGASGGLLMGVYIISCVLIRPHLDRIGVKRLVVISSFLTAVNCFLLSIAPTVTAVLLLVSVQAIVTGAFWSPLTGWISGIHEGKALNQRLARFSFGWSAGNIAGPLLGGPLLNTAQWLPFVVLGGLAAFLFLLAGVIHQERAVAATDNHAATAAISPHLPSFRWMSRIAMIVSCIGLGMLRTPLASLCKELTPTIQAGTDMNSLVMGLSGGMQVVSFFLLGRTEKWHYRLWCLIGVQLLGAVLLAGVGWSDSIWIVGICAIAAMIATSYTYSSHVYYTLSGGAERSSGMALHEIMLSIGFTVGSFGGGFVGEWLNLRWAYQMAAAIWVTGMIVQLAIYMRWKKRPPINQLTS